MNTSQIEIRWSNKPDTTIVGAEQLFSTRTASINVKDAFGETWQFDLILLTERTGRSWVLVQSDFYIWNGKAVLGGSISADGAVQWAEPLLVESSDQRAIARAPEVLDIRRLLDAGVQSRTLIGPVLSEWFFVRGPL